MGELAQLFSNPATRGIGLDVLRSMFSSEGAKGRGSLSVIEDDEKFLKEFRAVINHTLSGRRSMVCLLCPNRNSLFSWQRGL